MAHFAELDANNIVLRVIVISNDMMLDENGQENELRGISFCQSLFGADTRWVQTSYNTVSGRHRLGGTPLRKNFAGPGYVYNAELDAFVPPCPFPSWQIDPVTGHFEPPVPPPQDGQQYEWHEPTLSWQLATTQVVNQE